MSNTVNGEIDIINRAIQILGDIRITGSGSNTPLAREISSCYRIVRDKYIQSAQWSCCTKDEEPLPFLEKISGKRLCYKYALASDFISLQKICDHIVGYHGIEPIYTDRKPYAVRGRYLFSIYPPPLKIDYSFRNEDYGSYDPSFAEGLSIAIAIAVCQKLKQNDNAIKNLIALELKNKEEALYAQALELPPDPVVDGNLIMAREVSGW